MEWLGELVGRRFGDQRVRGHGWERDPRPRALKLQSHAEPSRSRQVPVCRQAWSSSGDAPPAQRESFGAATRIGPFPAAIWLPMGASGCHDANFEQQCLAESHDQPTAYRTCVDHVSTTAGRHARNLANRRCILSVHTPLTDSFCLMSPEVLESFFDPPRSTSLPYADWLTGQRLLLVQGTDFNEDPRRVANKVLGYARRKDWAAVAVLTRRPTDPAQAAPRCIQVWGDPSRSYADGPPEEILRELGSAVRRRQRVRK